MSDSLPVPPDALAIRLDDAGRALGLSRASVYRLIGEGRLAAVKIAGRTLILADSLRALVEHAPAAQIRHGRVGRPCRQPPQAAA